MPWPLGHARGELRQAGGPPVQAKAASPSPPTRALHLEDQQRVEMIDDPERSRGRRRSAEGRYRGHASLSEGPLRSREELHDRD